MNAENRSAKRRRIYEPYFVAVWNRMARLSDVASATGLSKTVASWKASMLRRDGVFLRSFKNVGRAKRKAAIKA